jgi:hypothetical protein
MTTRIKEYIARAEWCEEQAGRVRDPEVSRVYLELARGWREFAAGPLVRPPRAGEAQLSVFASVQTEGE